MEKAQTAYDRLIAKPRPEELAQAKANVEKLKVVHAAMEARLQKSRELHKDHPELVPDVQWLDDQEKESTARAEFQIAEAALRLLEKGPREEVRKRRGSLSTRPSWAWSLPRGGAFRRRNRGHSRSRGKRTDLGTPLATIVNTSTVIVQARMPADRLPEIVKKVRLTRKMTNWPWAKSVRRRLN